MSRALQPADHSESIDLCQTMQDLKRYRGLADASPSGKCHHRMTVIAQDSIKFLLQRAPFDVALCKWREIRED